MRSVSVIIPNLNSPIIDETLSSLLIQTALSQIEEILVVGMDAPGLITTIGPIRFIPTSDPVWAPVARNIGIRESVGDILVFIDADCVAETNWLEGLLSAYDKGHRVVGGAVSVDGNTYWQRCYNLTMFHNFLPTRPSGKRANLGSLNLLVSREVMEEVGLFDERLRRGQDTELTLRMRRHGHDLYFEPRAIVKHFPKELGISGIWKRWYLSGSYNAFIRSEYRDVVANVPFYKSPIFLKLLSPYIGFIATLRNMAHIPLSFIYWNTLPVIYLTKIAWCFGAADNTVVCGSKT